jgi:hypothetical protein
MATKDRLEKLIATKKKNQDKEALEFLESLRRSLEDWGELTAKQSAALERVEYLSSDEGKIYVAAWQEEYSKNLIENAKICASYYLANPPYFNDLASKVLYKVDFIPTEKQYRALCENKYATKVLKEYNRKPEFSNGEIVQIRDISAMPYHLFPIKGKPCVVINNSIGKITTHAKGAKIYKILPFGKSSLFDCQERYLKGMKPQKSA